MIERPRRLMVLGAGPWQLPLIRKAAAAGAWVISVDNIPGNVGHASSHQFVNCDTTDPMRVLAHARQLRIDGIATMASDIAVPTLGFVAEHLGLPGCTTAIARRLTNKAEFRAFQRACPSLSAPAFVYGCDFRDLYSQLVARVPAPVVFKAVDSSGSRGVSVVESLAEGECRAAFQRAQRFSASRTVCAEGFVPGEDVSGDGFMCGGKLLAVVTRKYSAGVVPLGHRVPTHLPGKAVRTVIDEVQRTCGALGYHDGPLDFDVRVESSRVTVLEMSARLGGNGVPGVIERATGLDFVGMTIAYALGEDVRMDAALPVSGAAGSYVFGSSTGGVLRSVTGAAEFRAAVPEVFEFELHRRPGDRVHPFEHSGNSVGHVLFDCAPPATYDSVLARIAAALKLDVAPAAGSELSAAAPVARVTEIVS